MRKYLDTWIRTGSAYFGRWCLLLDSAIFDTCLVARCLFNNPPKSQRNDKADVQYSAAVGHLRSKHSHLDNRGYLAETIPGLPSDNFYMVADDIALAIRGHYVRANLHHARVIPQ